MHALSILSGKAADGMLTHTKTPLRVANAPLPGCNGVDFDQVEHLVPDEDPDSALCGLDVTDVPWNEGLPLCQACVAVAEGWLN
jgi:hypothetical protein